MLKNNDDVFVNEQGFAFIIKVFVILYDMYSSYDLLLDGTILVTSFVCGYMSS